MNDIQQKEHEAWWRGFKVGTENAIEFVTRHLKENPRMPIEDLILRVKVSAINKPRK